MQILNFIVEMTTVGKIILTPSSRRLCVYIRLDAPCLSASLRSRFPSSSKMLKLQRIDHQVLNAKLHQKEADIVALAGLPRCRYSSPPTWPGRGTDIKLHRL